MEDTPATVPNDVEEENNNNNVEEVDDDDIEELNLSCLDDDTNASINMPGSSVASLLSVPDGSNNSTTKGYNSNDDHDYLDWNTNNEDDDNDTAYILGTLIVRVVAARCLNTPHNNKTCHPYGSVRFGTTTQRTSQVYHTHDPIWPRGETMYMDVLHPAFPRAVDGGGNTTNNEVKSVKEHEPTPTTITEPQSTSTTATQAAATSASTSHPGDPPKKQQQQRETSTASLQTMDTHSAATSLSPSTDIDPPILTVALFHESPEQSISNSKAKYNPTKPSSGGGGDSDDVFLGMASVDLTPLLTGCIRQFDDWLPITGGSGGGGHYQHYHHHHHNRTAVRIVCEYEPTDPPPSIGDRVQCTYFSRPTDLYPARHHTLYTVSRTTDPISADTTELLLLTKEHDDGWMSTVTVHRHMVVVTEHRPASVLEACHDELLSLTERLVDSPLVHTLQTVVHESIPEQGVLQVAADGWGQSLGVLGRWIQPNNDDENGENNGNGGFLAHVLADVRYSTNWDGTAAVNGGGGDGADQQQRRDLQSLLSLNVGGMEDDVEEASTAAVEEDVLAPPDLTTALTTTTTSTAEALPNMPSCPITGTPLQDPVVAADGHTYERAAIARWLLTSTKSPLTGAVLAHKQLVPNYMLVASVREQSSSTTTNSVQQDMATTATSLLLDDDEMTAEVSLVEDE